jgi:glycosyltransferase involved in cell wall biosynthesis
MIRMLQLAAWDYSFHAHLRPLLEAFRSAGFDVCCAGAAGPFVSEIRALGFRFFPLPLARSMNPARHAFCVAELARLLRREQVEVLHSHTLVAGVVGRLAARAARVPLSVYTAHGFRFHEHMGSGAYWPLVFAEKLCGALTDHVFVQNDEDRLAAVALRLCRPERIQTIGSGIELARFDKRRIDPAALAALRSELGIPASAVVITSVARRTRDKGLGEFLDMAERVSKKHAKAHFIGVWPALPGERAKLELRRQRAATCVRILGYRSDVPAILALSDIFVQPSYFEGFSKVLMEAMALGSAVVASDVRGCRNLVVHEETGLLFRAKDAEQLAEQVSALVADSARREQLGRAASEYARRHFDERRSLELQVAALERLLSARALSHAIC